MSKVNILIVEDEKTIVQGIQLRLNRMGYKICGSVSTGKDALRAAHDFHPDLILMDILLKGDMDGIQTAGQIRACLDIPVIFLTAYADDNTLQRAKVSEPFGYIIKPFEEKELHITIEMALYKHQMEKKLRASEERYREVVEDVQEVIFRTDAEGLWTLLNPVWEKITGFSVEDSLGKLLQDFVHPDDRDRNIKEFRLLIEQKKKTCRHEARYCTKDGSFRYIEVHARLILDENSQPAGTTGTLIDITERKRVERQINASLNEKEALLKEIENKSEELKGSRERFLTVLDSLDAGVYVADMETYEILFVNRFIQSIFGDVTGKICWQTIQAEQTGPCDFCTNDRLLTTGGEPTGVYTWEFKNTVNDRWYEIRDRAIRWDDGRLVRLEITLDITERKRAEAALRESEERFRQIVERSSDVFYRQNINTIKFEYISPKVMDILGRTPEEMKSMDYEEQVAQIHPDDLPNLIDFSKNLVEADNKGIGSIEREFRIMHKFGEYVWIHGSYNLTRDANGEPEFIVGALQDITERKQAEELLLMLNKAIDTSREVIFTTNIDGIITYINPEFTKMYGYRDEEVVGKETPRVLKSDTLKQEDYEQFWQAILNKQRVFSEYVNKTKDGKLIDVEASADPILDDHGDIIGFLAIQRDITKRKQAEKKLSQHLKELKVLNEITSAVTESIDLDKRLEVIMDKALEVVAATAGMIFLVDKKNRKLSLVIDRGLSKNFVKAYKQKQIDFGEGLTGRIAVSGKPIYIKQSSSKDSRIAREVVVQENLNSFIGIPLKSKGELLGVMNILTRAPQSLSKEDVSILTTIGNEVGITLENAKLFEEVNLERQKLEKIVDGIGGGLSLIDRDYRIIWANKFITDSFGSLEQLIGNPCYKSYFGRSDKCDLCACQKSFKSGQVQSEEKLINNGREKWYQLTSAPIKDSSGKVVQVLEFIQDITERKLIEKEQAAHLHYFKSMYRVSEILEQSDDLDRILQKSIQELLNIFKSDRAWLLHPIDPEAPTFSIPYMATNPEYPAKKGTELPMSPSQQVFTKQVLATKDPTTVIYDVATMDDPESIKTVKQYSIRSQLCIVIHPKVGKPWMLGLHQCSYTREWTEDEQRLFKDISSRINDTLSARLLHQDLQKSEEKYRTLFEDSRDAIYITTYEGRLIDMNQATLDLFGYTKEELIGTEVLKLYIDTEDRRRLQKRLDKEGSVKEFELKLKKKDGSEMDCLVTTSTRRGNGQILGYQGIIRDVTEQKRAQADQRRHLDQTRALRNIVEKLNRAYTLEDVYTAAIEGVLSVLQADRASVLLFDTDGVIRFKAWEGLSSGYRKAVEGHFPWEIDDLRAEPITIPNITKAELSEELRATILKEGIHAGAFIPLVGKGQLLGKFMTYYDQPHAFEPDEMHMSKVLADNLATVIERLQGREALQESEEKYRSIFEHTLVGIAVHQNGKIVFTNPTSAQIMGYDSADEFIGKSVLKFVHPDYQKIARDRIKNMLSTKGYVAELVEEKFIRKDGTSVNVAVIAQSITYHGTPAIQVSFIDITERIQAEVKLKQTLKALNQERNMFISGPVVVFKWQKKEGWPVEYVSANVNEVFGYTPEKLTSGEIPYSTIVYKDDLERVAGEVATYSASGADSFEHLPYRIIKANRDVIWIADYTTILRNAAGKITHYLGYIVDITEAKMAEHAVQRQAEELKLLNRIIVSGNRAEDLPELLETVISAIIESMKFDGGGIFLLDEASRVAEICYSQGLPEDFVKTAGRVKIDEGPSYEMVFIKGQPLFSDNYSEITPEQVKTGGFSSMASIPLFSKGKVIGALNVTSNSPHIFSKDEKELFQSIGQEAGMAIAKMWAEEERERLNRELLNKNKELEQIIYVASHDLRSPLVNIQGFSMEMDQAMQDINSVLNNWKIDKQVQAELRPIISENIPEALHYIQTSTTKMDSLINGLLRLSRLGRATFNFKQLDMNKILSNVLETFRYQIEQSGAVVQVEKLPACWGDEPQINQVFSNLIDNALKFLNPNRAGTIQISGKETDRKVVYFVEDNGVGIDPKYHQEIYEIFHCLDPEMNTGEGLGLTIVRRIMDRHSGRIWVESKPGQGSKFFISLPNQTKFQFA